MNFDRDGPATALFWPCAISGCGSTLAHLANRRVRALTEMSAFLAAWALDLFSAGRATQHTTQALGGSH